ncbi:MAG: FAD:protein FMN transferase [Vicinamibacterales bacterium]
MRHPSVLFRVACLVAAAALSNAMAGCAPPSSAAPAPAPLACTDLTPDRAAGLAHHLRAERPLMGTSFQIRVVTPDIAGGCAAMEAAFAEVAREEALFSEYRPESEVSAINRAAGGAPVQVDAEVFGLLQRSLWASRVTRGAFDMTFAGCGGLWSVRDRRVPDAESLAACMPRVGFQKVRLDERESSALLPEPGMRIGLGGIAKGYGVDRAVEVLLSRGFTSVVVDGGGDLRVEGADIDGPWTVNIAHPRRPGRIFETVHVARGAVVTSGDYLRYFERDGVRYHHIIDPATGRPAARSMAVTVIAPTAADADALATGLFVLGPERGLAAIASVPGVEALYFAPDLSVHASPGFPRGTRPAGPDLPPDIP